MRLSEHINSGQARPRRVLMVAANPGLATNTGWPVGFWASELTHPWLAFTEAGYEVVICSPLGGRLELDAMSDPRHESGYSADDLVSLGFLNSPRHAGLLESTPRLADCPAAGFDALVICGGQAPMFHYRGDEHLKSSVAAFFESGKVVAALCHGVSALIDVQLSDGSWLIAGKTMTGFSNVEEDFVDTLVGMKVMPWRIEDAARERGANYVGGGLWRAFAVRDGRLVTGQQQYSGRKTAELVMEVLGR
ncbi:MAG: type 1 glutamine amidotransferase domain-containing protein [Acidobacteria bacterium]|nr:type 1 glutamine amidotransferase domain-containing protein [Acidobacteriota bacterium]